MKINCIIIDDEPSSQHILHRFIEDIDFLNLVGTANNPVEALPFFTASPKIHLLFLDINMPKVNGLDFYKSLQNPPDVIFTTAYPQYAVEGFEVNAVDYLLKPFSFPRFLTAVHKIRDKHIASEPGTAHEYLIVKSNKVLHKVAFKDIIYVEAYGDYVKIHRLKDCLVTNSTFSKILASLTEKRFIRIHKSFAINLDKLNKVSGNQAILLEYKVPIGLKYKVDFLNRIAT
ncbi:LytR/AlgR family response regulator transcription factor [Spongiimicrobium salis]|uniref:LytR/AlgR family response regulator transcription factor n=1 Tax=Spongiimicrobium salis TaxID=1667022 RepID=UPI00374D8A93